VLHPDRVLVKTSTTVAGRQRDAQMIEVPGAYTLLKWFSTTRNTPWGKDPCAWLVVFLENVLPFQQWI